MRSIAWALLLCTALAITAGREPQRRVIEVSTAEELIAAFREPLENVTVKLAPGTYELKPSSGFDPAPYDCDRNSALVPIFIGLLMSGKNVTLRGPERADAIIVTNASHGIYLKDCVDCLVEKVTVTGVRADLAPNTTCGAVVARNSSARVAHCVIRDNRALSQRSESSAPSGVCGRDGANLNIEFNEVLRNARGIVLCNGSRAIVRNNLIEQIDSVGYDAGIWVVCNAIATIERNHIRNSHTSGIVATGTADVVCRANIVENNGDTGIAVMSRESAHAVIEDNVVYECGTGVRIAGGDSVGPDGKLSNNLIVECGFNLGAIHRKGNTTRFDERRNTVYVTQPVVDGKSGSNEMFWRARRPWTRTYRNTPVGVDGRHKFHESAFLTRYGRWLH